MKPLSYKQYEDESKLFGVKSASCSSLSSVSILKLVLCSIVTYASFMFVLGVGSITTSKVKDQLTEAGSKLQ